MKSFQCEKPKDYFFIPGQATEVSINKEGWKDKKRPFTFTSLNDDSFLEFTIKIYSDHQGVTNKLGELKAGDELMVRDIWGAIEYKGPGYFIAGGAGITPFIAIFRHLFKQKIIEGNQLFFSNKSDQDIILEDELHAILGEQAIHIITDDATTTHYKGFINEEFLRAYVHDFSKNFYVCGPPKMVASIQQVLTKLGVSLNAVVFEK